MTGQLPKFGLVLGSTFPPSELIAVARTIEASGFDSVWVTEDYFLTGGVSAAAVVLGATERLAVGTGLLSAYARHPALTAMEAATLAAVHPGRFRLGLGCGGLVWLEQQGIAHRRPLSAVRGNIEAIRALLTGDELTGDFGGFAFDQVRLTFPPDQAPPIFLGATGPRMTALAGELADGLLLSVFSSPEFVRGQRAVVGADKPVSTFAFFALDDSVEQARARVRPVLASFLADGESSVMTDAIGISEQLSDLVAKGGEAELLANMPDSWVDQLAVCGDIDTCADRIRAFGEAGSDEVALVPVGIDALSQDIERLGSALQAG